MNIADAIARAERAQADLIKALAEARKGKDEWPKVGDNIYTLHQSGFTTSEWVGLRWQLLAMQRGAAYRTQAAAERADQRRIVEAELRKMAREAGKVMTAPWYEVAFEQGTWDPITASARTGLPRFPTRESAEAAIAALGDRLNLLLDEGE